MTINFGDTSQTVTRMTTDFKKDRYTQLDTIRGLAIMGILIMNFVSFAFGDEAYFDISLEPSHSLLDLFVGVFGELFADQKFMGLFSLLFGASLVLFLERAQAKTSSPALLSLRRNAFLLLFGLVHASFWRGDILLVYALCAPVLLFFRNSSSRTLIIFGSLVYILAPVTQWEAATGFDDTTIRMVWQDNIESSPTGITPAEEAGLLIICDFFFRALGMMLIGMGLYRAGYFTRFVVTGKTLGIGFAGLFVGLVFAGLGVACSILYEFDARYILKGNIFNSIATVPMVASYVLFFTWWDQNSQSVLLEKTRALGQMALTNYLAQTAIGLTVVALLPAEYVTRASAWLLIPLIWWAQLNFSQAWLKKYRSGPVEWLWRCLTAFSLLPLKR